MTKYDIMNYKCKKCGKEFEAKIYSSINYQLNPELVKLFDRKNFGFNIAKCPSCGQTTYFAKWFVFHDMDSEIMVYVYPDDTPTREIIEEQYKLKKGQEKHKIKFPEQIAIKHLQNFILFLEEQGYFSKGKKPLKPRKWIEYISLDRLSAKEIKDYKTRGIETATWIYNSKEEGNCLKCKELARIHKIDKIPKKPHKDCKCFLMGFVNKDNLNKKCPY